jgi:hypothetical protein
MAKALTGDELIKSHLPKNYKYFIHIKDKTLEDELSDDFDWNLIDTIDNSEIVNEAMNATYQLYERETVASAKKPTILDDGVILSKKLATKTDKKLINVGVGFFTYDGFRYVSTKLIYERFDIYEVFCLV